MAAPMSAQAAANAILKSNIVVPTAKAKDGAENGASGANGSRPPIAKRKAIDDAAGLAGAKRKPQETTLLKKPAARAVPATGPASRPGAAAAAAPAKKAAAKVSVPTVTAASGAPKRPAWDMKGRLEDMEADYRQMQARMCETTATLSAISAQLAEKNMSVQQLNESKTAVIAQLEAHQREMESAAFKTAELNGVISSLKMQHSNEIDQYASKVRNLEMDLDQLRIRLRVASEELDRTKAQLTNSNEALAKTEQALKQSRGETEVAKATIETRNAKVEELQLRVTEQEERIKELERKTREDEKLRRKLHNTIQELKGNIRVYCRVRPAKGADELLSFAFLDDRNMEASAAPEKNALGKAKAEARKWNFTFDKVFSPASTQEQVFTEVSQLVQSALDGYNTCIFAYGQTGSGKTFTMEGPEEADDKTKGVIPRSVEQVFTSAREMEEQGWTFEMEASFLEIYNESIQDLLCTSTQAADREYKIIHDQKGNTSVTDLTVVKVVRPSQVYELLKRAAKNRSVGSTKMNERSSRSHSVFQMRIKGRNTITNEEVKGLLNLIDLAGSERLDSSGATGDRLTETKNINKSLSCLADVISALATKEAHIPYRNSKLTYLLQNSLGGNSKTLMFVNVSPSEKDLPESLNSLRFATKVNACDIGTAKKITKVDLK